MKRKGIPVKLLTDESTTLPTIEALSPKGIITVSILKRVNEVDVGEFIDFPDNQFNMDPLSKYFKHVTHFSRHLNIRTSSPIGGRFFFPFYYFRVERLVRDAKTAVHNLPTLPQCS
jgi:hypothetical protein